MSIAAMMQDAAEARVKPRRQRSEKRVRGSGGSTPATTAPGPDLGALASELLRYVPTEAVVLYTTVLPFLISDETSSGAPDYTSRWVLVVVVAILALLFSVGVYRRALIAQGVTFRWPPKRTTFVLVAFLGWVLIIPGSPFAEFSWYSPDTGALIGLGINTLLNLTRLWWGEPESP